MEAKKINQQIQLQIAKQLYKNSLPTIFAGIINTLIVTILFRNLVSPTVNYGWGAIFISYLLCRLYFTNSMLKKEITANNYLIRLKQFTGTIFISGLILGSASFIFLSADRPAHNAFMILLFAGMLVGSLSAFSTYKPAFFAFFFPIIIPVVGYNFILGGEINITMACLSLVFTVVLLSLLFQVNKTMTDTIRLGIENTLLAEKSECLNKQLLASNQKYQQLSYCDTLTQIKNRRFVMDVLDNEICRFGFSLRKDHPERRVTTDPRNNVYGVYIIDIDHFKKVNDAWGHKCGDQMIIQFVERLKSLVRKDDVLARWGGEEFVVVLKRTSPDYLACFAEKVITAISSEPFILSPDISANVSCSLGYAKFPFFSDHPQLVSLDKTIEIADQALYFAKTNGRSMAVRAAHSINPQKTITIDQGELLINNLPQAIERQQILLTPTADH